VNLFRHIDRSAYFFAFCAVVLSLLASAPLSLAQSAGSSPSHDQTRPNASGDGKAATLTPDSRIDAAQVTKRVNEELGTDLQAATADWQRQLDQLEKELSRPHLRYSELNEFRDRLKKEPAVSGGGSVEQAAAAAAGR